MTDRTRPSIDSSVAPKDEKIIIGTSTTPGIHKTVTICKIGQYPIEIHENITLPPSSLGRDQTLKITTGLGKDRKIKTRLGLNLYMLAHKMWYGMEFQEQ